MAKEVDLKKIELKVSANCCEGCKRKVKKSLRSVEGVLKTEIDHSQPKLTVLGNVDPQILVKKLRKIGKQAQIISKLQDTNNDVDDQENEYQNHQVQKKTDEKERIKVAETILLDHSMSSSTSTTIIEKEKVEHIHGSELNSTLDQSALKYCSIDDHSGQSNKSKAGDGKGNGKKKARSSSSSSSDKLQLNVQKRDCNNGEGNHHHQEAAAAEVIKNTITVNPYTSNTPPAQLVNNFTIQPSMVRHDTANCMSYTQYSYAAEPISSASTAYYNAPDSHNFSSPNSVYYRQRDGHFYGYDERQANPSSGQQLQLQQQQQLLLQPPVPRVGDYFSDENVLGCHVM